MRLQERGQFKDTRILIQGALFVPGITSSVALGKRYHYSLSVISVAGSMPSDAYQHCDRGVPKEG